MPTPKPIQPKIQTPTPVQWSTLDAAKLEQARAPGVGRRILSALYDLMLVAGVLVLGSTLVTLPYQGLFGGDLTRGVPRLLFQAYLLGLCVLYYLYFWSAGRQSLGMRAWRLQLVRLDGQPLGWQDALRRLGLTVLCMAPAGLGLWWAWFNRDRLGLHDQLSGTRLVMLAKPNKGGG
ncbi:RDD family protein [Thiorhodovibrio winogradskyi]|uniref:RDD family protein n=1 Tax=Thiorhodovibrio winogradskyi TaxID=77007 RepID=A0ABZ0S8F9_9GAMM|nr:RDD family protein [Thiorhodovibrio winogradskyi]